jgi:hypothetical protein
MDAVADRLIIVVIPTLDGRQGEEPKKRCPATKEGER